MTKRSGTEPEQHSSLTRTTLHGVAWMTGGRFLKAPTNLIAIAILARLLTPADFGVVAIGFLVIGLANVLVDGTFGMVLVQRRTIDPAMIGASLLLSAGLGALFGLVLLAAAPLLEVFFQFPELSAVLRVLAAVLPISAAMAVTTGLLQRGSRFGVLTINSFLAQLVYAVTAVVLAFAGFGLWSLVWGQIAQACVEAFLGYLAVRTRYAIAFTRSTLGEAFRSGGMFTISKLFNWASGTIDSIVVGRLLGASSLGLYSRAASLMTTANQMVGTGTARVLFSTFAKMQHDRERMRRAFIRALSTSTVVAAFASAFAILFADVIVRVLLGPKWLAAIPILQLLFAAFVTRSGYIVAEAVPLALGLGRASAYRQAAHFGLIIGGAWIGSHFGLVGAAAGIATAYWIFYLLCLLLVQRLLRITPFQLLNIHLKAIAAIAFPILITIAARLIFHTGSNLVLNLGLAILFVLASVMVLGFGPASLLSEDIVRLRTHLFDAASSRIRRIARAR